MDEQRPNEIKDEQDLAIEDLEVDGARPPKRSGAAPVAVQAESPGLPDGVQAQHNETLLLSYDDTYTRGVGGRVSAGRYAGSRGAPAGRA